MRLSHINLTVTDVPAAKAFLSEYFELEDQGGNAGMGFLFDDQGMVVSLMKAGRGGVEYPPTFHIGFFIEGRETVDALHARLIAAGHDAPAPEDNGHAYGFYVQAPGGFTVEVGA
ncbi:MAG TPA: VOC family protein [Thermomicrobiales bacterium]|jgi:catechol 2,3-dioxygenase-like lactoylglutathione lyase family enzyme|nr:VOC family protein [Thermomicrobiales bacterium]